MIPEAVSATIGHDRDEGLRNRPKVRLAKPLPESCCQVPVPARHFGSGTSTTLLTRGLDAVDLAVTGPAVRRREGAELLRAVVADRMLFHDGALVGDLHRAADDGDGDRCPLVRVADPVA